MNYVNDMNCILCKAPVAFRDALYQCTQGHVFSLVSQPVPVTEMPDLVDNPKKLQEQQKRGGRKA